MKRFAVLSVLACILFVLVPALAAQASNTDVYGRPLPDDAAPYNQQVWQTLCNSSRTETALMSAVSVYARICDQDGFDKFGNSLVLLDQNLHIIPGAASSWDVSKDGLTWSFHLKPGQVWSDGTPLTAADYVATYQYMADAKSAYDFSWVWQGVIANWTESVAGEVTPDQIGVKAVDANTFAVTTTKPLGFLPLTLYFWPPLQAAALKKYGTPDYTLDPAKSVSSGPFILKSFTPGKELILDANPTYKGYRPPVLSEIRGVYGDQSSGSFLAFQNHDIDTVNYGLLSPADFSVIFADPTMTKDYHPNMGDFRSDYLFFDTYNPPFNDVNVRLAFAKAVDRDSIVKNVIGSQFAMPALSYLAPGFPDWDSQGDFKDIQSYDCTAAQALLAKAGFPDGKGFPTIQLQVRDDSASVDARFLAAGNSISKCLNIPITVNNVQSSTFMSALNARPTTVQFGAVSYGMDYLDPSNMLGLWVSTGRQSWRNADYDNLINEAAGETDQAKRAQEYHDAEKILVSDVGGVFIDWRIQGDLYQPYVAGGDCFTPDSQGVSAWHWGNDFCWGTVYITKDVSNFKTYRDTSS